MIHTVTQQVVKICVMIVQTEDKIMTKRLLGNIRERRKQSMSKTITNGNNCVSNLHIQCEL